ncbi:mitochondrial carrier domain-containing protein [Melampsora americana]|nr:mitochondrial carrier domain-containing protein [Melampsora americana]
MSTKTSTPLAIHLIAGGTAGFAEACVCHPLDTIKVRMQLSRSKQGRGRGFIKTGVMIAQKESFAGLYKGLGAVISGIVPKMSIRFASFEAYKGWLADKQTGKVSSSAIFLSGLGAGTTEAVAIVCPMEVVKIRLQAQMHSMSDPLDIPKYRNAGHALYLILKEEGPRTLYRGVALTALRQATNQAANFTAYTELKALCQRIPTQTMALGLISGAVGPFTNAPIDTIKTRIQKSTATQGETAWTRLKVVSSEMFVQEGPKAFYKGITPRVMRVAPGQAVVFTVYEKMKGIIEKLKADMMEHEE